MYQFIHQFFCTIQNTIRNTCKLCHLDTITFIGTTFYDFSQKYDIIAPFFHRDTVIINARNLSFQLCQFVIMGSKQSLCSQKFCITDVFDNCPGNGQSVKGTGSTANLIQDQQTLRSRIAKNIGHLCHLHHERTLSAGQVVRSSDTGENPVYHTNLCFFCRNKRTNLRHQNNQGTLTHVC